MNKKVVVIVACILAILLLVGGYLFFSKKDDDKVTKNNNIVKNDIVLKDDGTPRYVSGDRVNTIIEKDDDVFKALDELKNIYGFDKAKDVFNILRTDESGDFKYYRLQQKYSGINVYGSNIIVTVNKDNKVVSFTGNYASFGSVGTYIDINKVKEVLKTKLVGEAEFTSEEKYIYCEGEKPVIVVVFDVIDDNGYYEYIVDKDGNVLDKFDLVKYAKYSYDTKDIKGNNVTVDLDKTLGVIRTEDKDRNIYLMNGGHLTTSTAGWNLIDALRSMGSAKLGTVLPDPIIFDEKDGKIVVSSMDESFCLLNQSDECELYVKNALLSLYNFEKAYDYYNNVLGRKGFDNNGGKVPVYLNVKMKLFDDALYNNASWVKLGYFMLGGTKDGTSYGSYLDIVAHEYTHAVTQYTSGLGGSGETGALNEAYSDIMGSVIDGNFIMGDDYIAFRNLENPNEFKNPSVKGGDYYFPTDEVTYNEEWRQEKLERAKESGNPLDDWKDWDSKGAHTNSTVPSHAAYLMYKNKAFKDLNELGKVWYNSEFLLSSNADFEDCAIAVIQSAKNLGLSDDKINIITKAFVDTKMLSDDNSSFSGTVTDKDGNGIEGVLVNVSYKINPHVYFEVYTDKDGKYSFEEIPCMDYEVTFTKSKYRDLHKDITVGKEKNDLSVKLEKISEENYSEAEIVFVLDISASMDENDSTDIRKQILVNMLSRLDSKYAFSLVTFAGVANVVNDGMSNKSNDKKILMTDIFNIPNDSGNKGEVSGTNGRAGLTRALKLFSDDDKRRYIVFFTDGEDNKDTDLTYDEIIEQSNKKNIRILSIGLGEDGNINDTILNTLADKTNGKYYHANSSIELYKFVDTIIGEIE